MGDHEENEENAELPLEELDDDVDESDGVLARGGGKRDAEGLVGDEGRVGGLEGVGGGRTMPGEASSIR